jgi:hypothetical protein
MSFLCPEGVVLTKGACSASASAASAPLALGVGVFLPLLPGCLVKVEAGSAGEVAVTAAMAACLASNLACLARRFASFLAAFFDRDVAGEAPSCSSVTLGEAAAAAGSTRLAAIVILGGIK